MLDLTENEQEDWEMMIGKKPCAEHKNIVEETDDCDLYIIKRHRCKDCNRYIDYVIEISPKTLEIIDEHDNLDIELSGEVDFLVCNYVSDSIARKEWEEMWLEENDIEISRVNPEGSKKVSEGNRYEKQ